MARVVKILGGEGGFFYQDYKIDANVAAGALGLRSTAVDSAGEVVNATTTGAVNLLGVYSESVTYTAAPTGNMGASPEGIVRIITHPFQIIELRASGGAGNVALATASPANILVNETADANRLTIAENAVGTISMAGGLIKGRTGANASQTRRISAHTDNTSTAVEVAFISTIAVGDTFIRVPWSKAILNVQLTTALDEADAIIATSTGCILNVYDVVIDESRDLAWVYVIPRSHFYNALA